MGLFIELTKPLAGTHISFDGGKGNEWSVLSNLETGCLTEVWEFSRKIHRNFNRLLGIGVQCIRLCQTIIETGSILSTKSRNKTCSLQLTIPRCQFLFQSFHC